ncbi:MAG: hypothetical protein M3126_07295 [Candidatus Eremiobacteraeota bacterium]|nr:hypothetical protein [Candidatus Eremiobacteraeota bacterium]
MRKSLAVLAIALTATAAPLVAKADVDASLIPDGTYTVKVDKIVDAQHMVVVMQNSVKTTVAANRATMDFKTLSPNDNVKLSLGKGKVLVFVKQ